MRRAALLPLLLLPSACAGAPGPAGAGGRAACTGEVRLANQGPVAVEQAYLGAPPDWGRDLLAPNTLPPGAGAVFRLPPARPLSRSLRVVFVNGRAAELPGLDLCETPELTVLPGGLRADAPRP